MKLSSNSIYMTLKREKLFMRGEVYSSRSVMSTEISLSLYTR
jgi:hypothetical protein